MFRSQFQRNVTCRIPRAATARRLPSKRSYSSQQYDTYFALPPVRALRPTLWVFAAVGTIYLSCAAYEVHQDVALFKSQAYGPVTYDAIDVRRLKHGIQQSPATMNFTFMDIVTTPWSSLNSAEKALVTAGTLNVSIFALNRAFPATLPSFWHIAASNRNYTLLTSMFGHSGLAHIFFNMYVLSNFGPSLAGSQTFNSSGSHLTAFYLSSGLLASLAQHLNTIWPNTASRSIPGLGASGAIMAMVGAWAMNYPEGRIGIIFLPGTLSAEQALYGLAAFETVGIFVGYPFLRLGHAAHLGGLVAGVAYVYFDGKDRMWQPARRFAFNQMRRVGLV